MTPINFTHRAGPFTFTATSDRDEPEVVRLTMYGPREGTEGEYVLDDALMYANDWDDDRELIVARMNEPGFNPNNPRFSLNPDLGRFFP